jgi:methylated-DNA-protein-cysteine methyltransferase-like protein
MVGWALNSTKRCPQWVPAHRVVNRNGLLTGKMHFPGSETMRELLESEGIVIENDRIQGFDSVFWDPNREIDL